MIVRPGAILFLAVLAAPALAQETDQLPRFEALQQQERMLEQRQLDNLETRRRFDPQQQPGSRRSAAERGIRDLQYQREIDQLRLEGELQRQQDQRQRDLAEATLPNRRIAAHSSLVVRDPHAHLLPPPPAGHYYARLEGHFVLVDATSELVVRVLDVQPTDPVADVPLQPSPPPQTPLPTGRISATSGLAILDFSRHALPPPPKGQFYARIDGNIILVDARTERADRFVPG